MHDGRARADVIGDRQCAAPVGGATWPSKRREEHLGVGIGDGQRGNLQDGGCLGDLQPLGVLGRADARGQRIAGIERHVGDRSALDPMGRAHRAGRIGFIDRIAVIGRIGIDDAADRAMLLREFGLQPAPALAVAGDDDLALDADAEPLQRLVVVLHSVIDVDQAGGNVAVALVCDIGGSAGSVAVALESPGIGGSCSVALNGLGPTSSRVSLIGVG